jgi:transcriptional regulator with XRE-family HTH domain
MAPWTRAAAFARGLQLAEMRRAAGVRQVDLAAAMGVSQARISKIEHGEISGIDVVSAYVAALGGNLDIIAKIDDKTWRLAMLTPQTCG